MNDPEFDPQEQDAINRLTNAPQPTLNPDAFEAIRARMFDAMDMPPQALKPGRQLWSRPPVIVAAVVTIVLVSGIAILISNSSGVTPVATVVPPTAMPTVATLPPTAVPTGVTVTAAPPPTNTVEVPPATNSAETTPEMTATQEPVIVVEGPVESIEDNVITIYGIDITLNPDDPILTVVQVGDVLHVEADYATDTTTIVAVTVAPVDNEVNVNPATGETWSDDGTCDHPPPSWATANGWRRRCENAPANNNSPGNGNGNGNGMGKGNDG